MISFVIPAHNEAELIGRTLSTLHESARAAGEPYEIIVADDASTDGTGARALSHGARVVAVNFRRIAATRNAGARETTGELLFFVDADTIVPARAVRVAVHALRSGAIGGGAAVRFDGTVPLYATNLFQRHGGPEVCSGAPVRDIVRCKPSEKRNPRSGDPTGLALNHKPWQQPR